MASENSPTTSNEFPVPAVPVLKEKKQKPNTKDRLMFEWAQNGLLSTYFFLTRDCKPWHQDIERNWADGTWLFELIKRPYETSFQVKAKYSKCDGLISEGFEIFLRFDHGRTSYCLDSLIVDGEDLRQEVVVKPYVSHKGSDGKLSVLKDVVVYENFYTFEWNIDKSVIDKMVQNEGEPDHRDNTYTAFVFKINRFPLRYNWR